MSFHKGYRLIAYGLLVIGLIAALALPGVAQSIEPVAVRNPIDKIAPWVLEHTAAGQQAEFLAVMTDQADLSGAAKLSTKLEKGRYVYDTLYRTAQTTQGPILQWLQARGVEYRAYYIVNLIWVKADRSVAVELAARSDVVRLEGNPRIRVIEPPVVLTQPEQPSTIEPNIQYVHAPDVWNMGFTGQGVVVGGQDTGYQWDHPALKNQYRGWNGTTANHDYNWHDSVHSGGGVCGANSPAPCDDTDHGTHTMGTAVGSDGGANQIGMAPGAKWIGCRNMDQGNGSPATYLECFEFFLAPYPVGGTTGQGDPSKAPDVTNNSWGCPTSEGCSAGTLLAAVEAQRAAGIMTVVSAGNSGSACSTVSDPPSFYDAAYTVGALNLGTDTLASFSSRGPVTADGSNRLKPDIAAPGTNIRLSVPGSGYQGGWSGTSMAGPHVAGAVALLWSARPALMNQLDATEQVLNNAAVHVSSSACSSSGWPNNLYGYGRLDVKAAVDASSSNSGILNGVVQNANTLALVPDVTVQAATGVTQTGSALTDASGFYSMSLPSGVYTLTTAVNGYHPATIAHVNVITDTTTTQNILLTPLAFYVVSGTVSDALTGGPLAATIAITGYTGGPLATNPVTGFYSATLIEGTVYTFTVNSPGYTAAGRRVGPLTHDRTEDFGLQPDLYQCTAPGYRLTGVSEPFDAASPPAGWSVISNIGAAGWAFNNPLQRTNLTGGTGNFAIIDSDYLGSGIQEDTELRTPVLNFSTLNAVTLTFKTDFRYYTGNLTEVADVDVSTGGAGGPWTNVWRKTAEARGPRTETIDLTTLAAGQPHVMVRFHYYNAMNEWWWQVDDVRMGDCLAPRQTLPAITPSAVTQLGDPGSMLTYTLNVSNTDQLTHTFDVLIDHNTWPITAPLTIGPVAAHTSQSLNLSASIPAGVLSGVSDVTYVLVRAQDDFGLNATATVTATANEVRGVQLEARPESQAGKMGAEVTYALQLTNTGNLPDTFTLELSKTSWPAEVEPISATVAAFASWPFTITVKVPLTTTPNLTDVVRVTATGTGVAAWRELITTALFPYPVYLPLIIK